MSDKRDVFSASCLISTATLQPDLDKLGVISSMALRRFPDSHWDSQALRIFLWNGRYIGGCGKWFTASVCCAAADLSMAADLRSRPHVFAIPALNKDVNTFAQRGGSSGRESARSPGWPRSPG